MTIQYVTHDAAYSLIKDGDILFLANVPTIMGTIIRFITRSQYSHCAFCVWATIEGQQRLLVIEQQGGTKRRLIDFEEYRKREIHMITNPKPWLPALAPIALEKLGVVNYGYVDAIYSGVRDWIHKTFGWVLPVKNLGGEICSEYVARVLQLQQYVDVSPVDVFNMIGQTPYLYIKK